MSFLLNSSSGNQHPVKISDGLIENIGFTFLGEAGTKKTIENFLTSDPYLIRYRQTFFHDLLETEELVEFISVLAEKIEPIIQLESEKMSLENRRTNENIFSSFRELLFFTECVDLWNKKYGQNPVVAYIVNSLFGNTKIKSANPNYVRNIFDVFAPDFDAVLAALDYRAPALIRRSMEEVYPPSSYGKLHILDLGCGTGDLTLMLSQVAGFLVDRLAQRIVRLLDSIFQRLPPTMPQRLPGKVENRQGRRRQDGEPRDGGPAHGWASSAVACCTSSMRAPVLPERSVASSGVKTPSEKAAMAARMRAASAPTMASQPLRVGFFMVVFLSDR